MGDYVIWLGENIEKQRPDLNWEQVMEVVRTTSEAELGKRYGLYLKDYLEYRNK